LGAPTALVLWYGGHQVIAGIQTIGGITQFILYLGMLSMPIRRLGATANLFSRSMSAGQRIFEVLDTESPVKEKPNAIELGKLKGKITFKNVGFAYNPLSPALNDINFSVQPGHVGKSIPAN
jgi:ABC-type multidrug transport system fused ATPase/permease subunit